MKKTEDNYEAISTEEKMSHVDDICEKLRAEGMPEEGLCLGSLDVTALYPSLVIAEAARMCGEEVTASVVVFEEVDWTWEAVYLALNMTQKETKKKRLSKILPKRKKGMRGSRPTVLTVETDKVKDRWEWTRDPRLMSNT